MRRWCSNHHPTAANELIVNTTLLLMNYYKLPLLLTQMAALNRFFDSTCLLWLDIFKVDGKLMAI